MKRDGVQRAVAFTQYPQYSCSTTGSSLNELMKVSTSSKAGIKGGQGWGGNGEVQWSVIDRWPTHPGLVEVGRAGSGLQSIAYAGTRQAISKNITDALEQFSPEVRNDVVILFSAHSLPLSVVKWV